MSQAKPPLIASPPPLGQTASFESDFPRGEAKSAKKKRRGNSPWQLAMATRRGNSPWQLAMAACHFEGRGRGDLRIDIIR